MPFSPISLEELYAKHSKLNSDELILDVRSDEEFKEGHIPGAKNIDHTSVANHSSDLKKYKRIYIYCRAGGRAQMATAALLQCGINEIKTLVQGGMPDWIHSGFPVER